MLLPPATKLGQGNIFRSVCPHSVHRGHAWLLGGRRAWLLRGGMHGCSGGACVVALGGHAWLLGRVCMVALGWGGMHGCSGGHAWLLQGGMVAQGACMVTLGGVHGCSGGHAWLLWGACMVALGRCAWLLRGVSGCSRGACVGYDEIQRYGQ